MAKQPKEKEVQPAGDLFNCFQALNYFKVSGGTRRVAEHKFKGKQQTITEWEELLKKERIIK